ncbi:MAG: DUF3999 family protein [Gammaproteobacteria bacterium]|nr:DUF3999 family protein [Gammaproteobacteria bacterium]
MTIIGATARLVCLWQLLFVAWAFSLTSAVAQTEDRLSNYSNQWEVKPRARGDIFIVDLPFEVYEASSDRVSLSDLNVFNRHGEPVPFILSIAGDEAMNHIPLPMKMIPDCLSPIDADRPVSSCIALDLTGLSEALHGLAITWQKTDDSVQSTDFWATAIVEYLDDQEAVHEYTRGLIGQQSASGDHKNICQQQVLFEPFDPTHLRLRLAGLPNGYGLKSVSALSGPEWLSRLPVMELKATEVRPSVDGYASVVFKSPMPLTPYRLSLNLPTDQVVHVSVSAGVDELVKIGEATMFQQKVGDQLVVNDTIWLQPERQQYWTVDWRPSNVFAADQMKAQLGWYSHRVVLLAQGMPPFTVVIDESAEEQKTSQRQHNQIQLTRLLEQQQQYALLVEPARLERRNITPAAIASDAEVSGASQSMVSSIKLMLWGLVIGSWVLLIWLAGWFYPKTVRSFR